MYVFIILPAAYMYMGNSLYGFSLKDAMQHDNIKYPIVV